MRLHIKLSLWLLFGLIIIVSSAQLISYKNSMGLITKLSESNVQLLKEREESFALNLFRSVDRAVSGSLERGEMVKFAHLLKGQRNIEGLLEFSLYDRNGVVTHSSDNQFLNKELSEEVRQELDRSLNMQIEWLPGEINIFQPLRVTNDCIRCHSTWAMGESGGMMHFRFSTAALTTANQTAMNTVAQAKSSALKTSAFALISIVLGLMATIYLLVKVFVGKPLLSIVHIFEAIAEGNLVSRVKINSRDEIGGLAAKCNAFVEKLQSTIQTIAKNAKQVDNASSALSEVSKETTASAEAVSSKSGIVATATDQMTANMISAASAMEQSAAHVSAITEAIDDMSVKFDEIAKSTIKASTVTSSAVAQTQNTLIKIKELGEAADQIGKVSETIAEISEQTNLLALNATIEAARAGEFGKGFAVVAHEIKELAGQTSQATLTIKEQIASIQNATKETISQIKDGTIVVNDVNDIVTAIASTIDVQSANAKEISSKVGQMETGIHRVTQIVTQSSTVAQQITNDISEVDQAANHMSSSITESTRNIIEMSKTAEEMHQIVQRFKT